MTPLAEIDVKSFLASTTTPAVEAGPMAPYLEVLTRNAAQTMAGAQIRTATGPASKTIADDECGAWLIAELGEPAVIALRDDLRPGEATWHAARLLAMLDNTPLTLEPGNIGLIGSTNVPQWKWSDGQEHELTTDDRAVKILRNIGVPKSKAGKFAR